MPAPPAANTASVVEVKTAADFENLVMAASSQPPPIGGPVILDFYADWCEPCKKLGPKLESLVGNAGGQLRLAKVNADNHPELTQALQVKSLPTVMLIHMGKLVDKVALRLQPSTAWIPCHARLRRHATSAAPSPHPLPTLSPLSARAPPQFEGELTDTQLKAFVQKAQDLVGGLTVGP